MIIRNPYRQLEKSLGYGFRRRRHLEAALTHRSFRFESDKVVEDNQRLEFLGDAVLGLVIGHHLYQAFPEYQEGELTAVRSRLTNSKILAQIAAGIFLGDYVRLGRGEIQSGGRHRASILTDALEAVLGAAFLDGGLRAVEKIVRKLFLPQLLPEFHDRRHDNPKGALQEIAQRRWRSGPRYRISREEGPPHSRVYTVEVLVNGKVAGVGHGPNKRDAEIEAARAALQRH